MPPPAVTVILPFFNAIRFLSEAIESVRSQTFRDWRLLLLDDGATDGSTDVARAQAGLDVRIEYVEHAGHANRGVAATRNDGMAQATGRYVAFLDADDVWLPQKLEQQVALLAAHPEAGYTYAPMLRWWSWDGGEDVLQDLEVVPGIVTSPPYPLPLFLLRPEAAPNPSALLIRRALAGRVGGFENGWGLEDQAFLTKLAVNAPAVVGRLCVVKYRQHDAARSTVLYQEGRHIDLWRDHFAWVAGYLERTAVTDRATLHAIQRARRQFEPSPPWRRLAGRTFHRILGRRRWARLRGRES